MTTVTDRLRIPTSASGLYLSALAALSVAATLLIAPVLPRIAAHFQTYPHATELAMVALTLPPLTVGLTSPFIGHIADRFGRIRLLYISLMIYGLLGVLPMVLDNLYQILLSRIGVGLAEAGIMTAGTTLIGDYFSGPDRERWVSRSVSVSSISAVVFLVLGGALGQQDWRLPFLVYAIAFPAIPVGLLLLHEPKARPEEDTTVQLRLPWSALRGLYVTSFLVAILFFVVPIQLPFLLTSRGYTSTQTIGLVTAASTAAIIAGGLLFQRMARRPLKANLGLALLLVGIGLAATACERGLGTTLVGVVISGLGCGIMLPAMLTSIMSHLPFNLRGRGVGVWNTVFFIGNFASPLVVMGLSHQLAGLALAFAALAVAAGLAGALTLVLAFLPPRMVRSF